MARQSFTVRAERRGALPLLRVQGELDINTAPRLQEAILVALTDGSPSLALDLSGVGLLDSTGLREVLRAKRATKVRNGEVYLVAVPLAICQTFEILGL